jgi:hypothetical protein
MCDVSRKNGNKLLAAEMDYLRRSCRRTRLNRIQNEKIREMMEMEKEIIHEEQERQLIWYGHTKVMEQTRWARKVLKWVAQEKCKGGRQRRSWR